MKFLLILLLSLTFLNAKIYKVGFAQDTMENDWRRAQVEAVKNEASKYDFLELTIKDAKANIAKQIEDIEFFIDNNFDFIITSPINAQIAALALKKAIKNGIKVILIDRGISSDDYTTFIAPDNYKIAEKAADFMVKSLNGKGVVLMLEGVKGATPTILRTNGFMDVISQYKDIKVIKRRANYLRGDAIKVVNGLFEQGIKFDAVYSQSDSMLEGFREAINTHNIRTKYITVGIDYIRSARTAIKNSVQDASFTYDTCGKEGIEAIVNIIKEKKVEKNIVLDSTMVTKENVNDVEPVF